VSGEKHKKEASPGDHFSPAKQRHNFKKIAIYLLTTAVISSAVLILLNSSQPPKAALVDHLSLTFPNQSFVDNATEILEQAGYTVDYYPGEEVTVEFYRDLPTHHYELVILRVHSGRFLLSNGTLGDDVGLFTGEPYDPEKYVEEEKAGLLSNAHYTYTNVSYFGITPSFVVAEMKGKFKDSMVILTGCDGARSDMLAKAFIYKGANAFAGWTGAVSASYTDAATESLLKHLLIEKLPLQEAMSKTKEEVGPDPIYGSELKVGVRQ